MGKQYPTRERFLALPLERRLGIFREVLEFHIHAAKRGYVSVDFYDGCVLYEEDTGRTLLCDVDAYHKMPFANPVGRMWGSTRFMAPEEFQKGAAINERTMVYTMGALALNSSLLRGGHFQTGPSRKALGNARKKRSLPKGRNDMRI